MDNYNEFFAVQGLAFWTYKQNGEIMFAEWDDDAQAFVFPEPLGV